MLWLLFGMLAGTLFGTAGAWSRGSNFWLRIVSLVQTSAIEAALGILMALLLGRSTWERLGGLAASVHLALVGFGSFIVAGFR